ncbi:AAA family ATPase [Micromonospora sp. NPDC005367]|uniref:ATP-binding protein n=1 Tax=Micromonospora sp. NPDC005367 TaxID=3155590 RepID=UPI0033A642C9
MGRDDALSAVVDALQHPSLVFVEGEAGIGKTRLVRESLAAVTDRRVLVAACAPWRDPFPLGPVVVGLRRLWLQVGAVEVSPLGGALRPLFPEWVDHLPPAPEPLEDPKETRHRLLCALTELVERLEVDVLVVEDAHWADSATLEWLLMLAATDRGSDASAIVVTYRPTDVPEGSLLLRLTARTPAGMDHSRVALEPLSVSATRELVASIVHTGEVSESFAEFLHERTDGVPLAVEECLRLLRDRKDIVRTGGQWSRRTLANLKVPPTVRDSVLERVERLHPDTRSVLQAAAVLNAPSDDRLITAVAGLDEHAGPLAVTAALASGLLQETAPGRLVFRHVLDEQAVAESIQPSDGRRLHARAAHELRQVMPTNVVRLSRHYREAGDTPQWCHYAEAAADLAWESGDDRTTVATLLELLTTVDHPPDRRARLARSLGESVVLGTSLIWNRTREVQYALRDVVASEGLTRADRGECRLLLGWLLLRLEDVEAGYEEIEAALPDLAGRPAMAAWAMLCLSAPWTRAWPASWHRQWLERAAALLPGVEPEERQPLFLRYAHALLFLGDEHGWRVADQVAVTDLPAQERQVVAIHAFNVAQFAAWWGRYGEARQRLSVATDLAAGVPRLVDVARVASAHLDWYIGAWDGLAETVGELAMADEVHRGTQLEARLIQGLLELAQGARGSAERHLHELQAELNRQGRVEPCLFPSAALGRASLADGDAEQALRVTECDITTITEKGIWWCATEVVPVRLAALLAAGRVPDAERLADQFAAGLGDQNAPASRTALCVCRAVLAEARGEAAEAARRFAEAAEAWAALPRPYDELLALECRGRCLLVVGLEDEALDLLSGVEQRFRDLGAKWDADRVAQLLRHHGVEVARVWRGGRRGYGDQLSPRELEVVELVARGLSNPQAAEALFLSPKTVERHVRAAMRKLSVSSRTALAMTAKDAGLLSSESGAVADR